MIYNREESEVQTLGDVEKFKVSIDERNINHIVTILSSNLYSHPMDSFLRETVSNALDSHMEAGVKEPVIITKTDDSLAIRDFGTGISPERFREIYLNIGSSTKRESNDYIGHFGIGRFSCLSVSPLANITSFYNGKAYYYVMNKDIDQLHIDLLYTKDTDEHNGVEVKIPVKDFSIDKMRCLLFVDSIYYKNDNMEADSKDFNNRKIASYINFKLFKCSHYYTNFGTEVLLGNIPYNVDYTSLWPADDNWHLSWKETFENIYPFLPIGSVDITPNREQLLYSEKTQSALRNLYDDCIEELKDLWYKQCNLSFDNYFKYKKEVLKHKDNLLHLEDGDYKVSDLLEYRIKFKNRPEWENVSFKRLKWALDRLDCSFFYPLGKENSGNIKIDNIQMRVETLMEYYTSAFYSNYHKIIAVPSTAGFSGKYLGNYLMYTYPGTIILFIKKPRISYSSIRRFIVNQFGTDCWNTHEKRILAVQVIKEFLLYMEPFVEVKDIVGSPEYQQYRKLNMLPKERKVSDETVPFTLYNNGEYRDAYTKKVSEIVPYIKKRWAKHRIVYSEARSPFIKALCAMNYPRLTIISVSKNNIKYLEEGLPSWVQPIEALYSPDNKTLIKYATAYRLKHNSDIYLMNYDYYPKDVQKKIKQICDYCNYYTTPSSDNDSHSKELLKIIPTDMYDPEIMASYHQVEKYLRFSKNILTTKVYFTSDYSEQVFLYMAMKEKKIRLGYPYYKQASNFTRKLLNAL